MHCYHINFICSRHHTNIPLACLPKYLDIFSNQLLIHVTCTCECVLTLHRLYNLQFTFFFAVMLFRCYVINHAKGVFMPNIMHVEVRVQIPLCNREKFVKNANKFRIAISLAVFMVSQKLLKSGKSRTAKTSNIEIIINAISISIK